MTKTISFLRECGLILGAILGLALLLAAEFVFFHQVALKTSMVKTMTQNIVTKAPECFDGTLEKGCPDFGLENKAVKSIRLSSDGKELIVEYADGKKAVQPWTYITK